jgi:glycolate oxidase FAD binding subunit
MADEIEVIKSIVRMTPRILPHGGRSKPALTALPHGATPLDLRDLSGILEYEPGEYTITARAGTPLAEVEAVLAENGQYLPFDPPFVDQGATLGGTVAAGLSGSGRYRYGGVRDFLIGVRFVDGQGRLVRGGGKVVKNAAGFDLPKLMVGSLGRLGVLVEVSFKVFPRPQSYVSLTVNYPDLESALDGMNQAASARMEIDALDLIAQNDGKGAATYALWVRVGGWEAVLPQRIAQLRTAIGAGMEVSGATEAAAWRAVREFTWAPADGMLVKVATSIAQIQALEQRLVTTGAMRRYAVGGNLGWIAWPGPIAALDQMLAALTLSGLVLRGETRKPWIGQPIDNVFVRRIKQALDPVGKFLDL